jgi:hypothetical protein
MGRGNGSSLTSAFLTPKPPASSVYVHVLEAPPPLKRSMSVMSPFPSTISVMSPFPSPFSLLNASWRSFWLPSPHQVSWTIASMLNRRICNDLGWEVRVAPCRFRTPTH